VPRGRQLVRRESERRFHAALDVAEEPRVLGAGARLETAEEVGVGAHLEVSELQCLRRREAREVTRGGQPRGQPAAADVEAPPIHDLPESIGRIKARLTGRPFSAPPAPLPRHRAGGGADVARRRGRRVRPREGAGPA
jgi:hypothetical protein